MIDLSYTSFLRRRLAEMKKAKKVDRTRLRLEIAAADLLSEKRYDELTVAEITQGADLAHGTFYRYFENRREIVLAVINGLSKSVLDLRPRTTAETAFDAIRQMNRFYVDYYRQNAGLMRSYVSLKTEDPAFAELGQSSDRWLAERVLRDVEKRCPALAKAPKDMRRVMVYSVMGMVDELLRKIYCGTDPAVINFADQPETIAEVLSIVWWRALYGGPTGEAASTSPGNRQIEALTSAFAGTAG